MQTIDVYILTGFLGSGKTTALNALLSGEMAAMNPALIINEFGSINVDGTLVERQDLTRYEINKGSIFCICTKTDFLKALTEIADGGRHSTLLIEATGIAETSDIESFMETEHLRQVYRVKGNLCVVDAANFTRVAAYLKPAQTQVRCADAIILNKIDLANEDERRQLRAILAGLNARATLAETRYGKLLAGFLDGIKHAGRGETFFEQPPAEIVAVSISSEGIFDRGKFYSAMENIRQNLLRVKGHVRFRDGLRFVELAGSAWSETDPVDGFGGASAFSVIAWKLERQRLKEDLMSCAAAV